MKFALCTYSIAALDFGSFNRSAISASDRSATRHLGAFLLRLPTARG
jgi:hypothetical protein